MQLPHYTFYGNLVRYWIIALAITIGVFVALRICLRLFLAHFAKLSKRTKTDIDDLVIHTLHKTRPLILFVVSMYMGSLVLQLSDRVHAALLKILIIVLWLQIGVWATAAFRYWLESYRKRKLATDASAATVITAMGYGGQFLIWLIVLIVVLDNLGVKVTTLIAGLGVGGIAIALAVQSTLGDVLASLSIIFDKPFVIGDYLSIGELQGTVEHIGLKTTRLRSLSGEQLVFSNNDLLQSRIRNFQRMAERRVSFSIGVTYETPREKLVRIPEILRAAVEAETQARFDRSHFKAYAPSSLDFETVYYVLAPAYGTYMDVQQGINLRIHEALEKEGIEFAYPTQTVHVVKPS
jgi:small-conductance mechanosensitive channel